MNNWILKNLRMATFNSKCYTLILALATEWWRHQWKFGWIWLRPVSPPVASKMKETKWAPLKIPNMRQHIQKKKTQLFKLKIVLIWFIITWPSKPYEFSLSMRSVRLIWAKPRTCKLKDNFTDTNSILVPCRDHFYYKYNILITSILKTVSMEPLNSIVD